MLQSKTKLLLPSTDLFTLPEVVDGHDDMSVGSADQSLTTAADAAAYLTDTNDDDDDFEVCNADNAYSLH